VTTYSTDFVLGGVGVRSCNIFLFATGESQSMS